MQQFTLSFGCISRGVDERFHGEPIDDGQQMVCHIADTSVVCGYTSAKACGQGKQLLAKLLMSPGQFLGQDWIRF